MSRISGKETKPEIVVRKYLFSKGLRFRKNSPLLAGKPDIVLPKYNVIVLIHGCFWHGHSCKAAKLPATRIDFWRTKINSNRLRDKKVIRLLRRESWKVIVIWQCQIRNNEKRKSKLNELVNEIKNNEQ